jgi:hypothetical protein
VTLAVEGRRKFLFSLLLAINISGVKISMVLIAPYTLFAMLELKLKSVALVRKQTIPNERSPLVGEVSANFCG